MPMVGAISILLAAVAFLLVACDGPSALPRVASLGLTTTTTGAGASDQAKDLAYAKCMRSHGEAQFPDPNPRGGFSLSDVVGLGTPNFNRANSRCDRLLPYAGGWSPAELEQNETRGLKYSNCMRRMESRTSLTQQ